MLKALPVSFWSWHLADRLAGIRPRDELAKILTADNELLYEKLIKDMGETSSKFQGWWDRMAEQYDWERAENGNWEIDFESCDIYLVY